MILLRVIGLALIPASLAAQPSAPPAQRLTNVFPSDARVEQFVLTADGRRSYYAPPFGGVWLYDRDRNTASRVVPDGVWDIALSPAGDALVYTKEGDKRRDQHVWIQPLVSATGLAAGAPRSVSRQLGDVPAVSPDGKWVAFARDDSTGVGQSVVVVPASGGTERVVMPALPSSVAGIRWTPDSKTLYVGVNPPVPFTCAESCLSMNPPAVWGSIRRVALAGGRAVVVATPTGIPLPGLSPDGKLIAFRDTGRTSGVIVADTAGRRVYTLTLSGAQRAAGWYGPSSLLTFTGGSIRRLGTVSLPAGEQHQLYEGTEFALEPSWMRDGRTASFMRFANRCEVRMMNADGTAPRTIALTAPPCIGAAWTADERWVVFTRFNPNGPPSLTAVEAATGRDKELRALPSSEIQWVLDGNDVLFAETGPADGGKRRVTYWQVGLDGASTKLREVTLDNVGSVAPLDRSRAIVTGVRPRDVRLVRIDGGAPDVVLLAPRVGFLNPRMSLSSNRQWIAFRQDKVLELVSIDGRTRRRVDLPFVVDPNAPLTIAPDGNSAVIVERPRPDNAPGLYFVDVQSRNVRQLMTYVAGGRWPELAISPDGRTLLYMITDAVVPVVTATDFAHLVR